MKAITFKTVTATSVSEKSYPLSRLISTLLTETGSSRTLVLTFEQGREILSEDKDIDAVLKLIESTAGNHAAATKAEAAKAQYKKTVEENARKAQAAVKEAEKAAAKEAKYQQALKDKAAKKTEEHAKAVEAAKVEREAKKAAELEETNTLKKTPVRKETKKKTKKISRKKK